MQILESNNPDSKSANLVAENIQVLKSLFPEAFTEGGVDFLVLKELLGKALLPEEEKEEKYGLNWFGKRKARQLALTPSMGTLRPCPEDSVDWNTTKNIMIEGDNLEVLKLLQKSYAGKVKLIYIDPPYNTGKDFVYPDNFQDNIKNYLELTGKIEGGRKMEANTDTSGRFHTDWLNMMYPRIRLARNLLRDDGLIIISIDEIELSNLRKLCEDVFGEENYCGEIIWKNSSKNDQSYISIQHEYMLFFVKNREMNNGLWEEKKEGLGEIYKAFDNLHNEFGDDWAKIHDEAVKWYKQFSESNPIYSSKHYSWMDSRGVYFPDNISGPNFGQYRYDVYHPVTKRKCKEPASGWRYPEDTMRQRIQENLVHFGIDETTVPNNKTYLKDTESLSLTSIKYKDGRAATKSLSILMGGSYFQNPKDVELLTSIFQAVQFDKEDIMIDFFAGSGTSGQVSFTQNSKDQGYRRYILVQLPEPLDPDNKDQKTAAEFCQKIGKPLNIAELTKERLRRAGKKIAEENPMFKGDLGFRVFKLDESNIRSWEPEWDNLEEIIKHSVDHIKEGRSEQDVLFELLLKLGLDLSVAIERKEIAGKTVYSIGSGILMVCLAQRISRDDVESLAAGIVGWHKALAPVGETRLVFRDSAFADDVAKTNMVAILEQYGLTNVRSL